MVTPASAWTCRIVVPAFLPARRSSVRSGASRINSSGSVTRTRQGGPEPLRGRQLLGTAAGQAVDPRRRERLANRSLRSARRASSGLQGIAHVLDHGQTRPEPQVLEDHADAPLVWWHSLDHPVVEEDLAIVGPLHPATSRASVVLPAPAGPSTLVIPPGRSSNDASSTAATPPYRFTRPSRMTRRISRGGLCGVV